VIPDYGWHIAFLIGGLPALYVFMILKKVPESVPYLINRGRIQEAHELVQKLERQCGVDVIETIEVKPVATKQSVSFSQLWSIHLQNGH
jgi:putative MFS transporter